MSKEIINEGKEALERALLLMKYDMKKTLTENVEVVSEQKSSNLLSDEDLLGATSVIGNYMRLISDYNLFDILGINQANLIAGKRKGVKGAVDALDGFVNEEDLAYVMTILSALVGKCHYDDVEEKTIPAITRFLELYLEDEGEELLDDVNSVGTSTLKTGTEKIKKQIAKIIQTSKTQSCNTSDGQKTDSNLGCLTSLKSTGKNKAGCPTYDINGQKYAFCSNGRANGPDGMANWSCSGGKIIYNGKTISSRGSGSSTQYTPCPANGPYKQGCKSDVVKQIQGCLGVRTTGNFGPLTQTALSKIGYSNGFTSADVENICNKGGDSDLASSNFVTAEKGI
jgi:hypothetical protein